MIQASSTSCSFDDLPSMEHSGGKPGGKKMKIDARSSAVCRYYAAGHCRRGSVCRFVHPLPESMQYEHPYTGGDDVHTSTQFKGWHQNIDPSNGYTTFPTYTITQGYETSSDGLDECDLSSSNGSAVAGQRLCSASEIMTITEPVSSLFPSASFYQSAFTQSLESSQYYYNTVTHHANVTHPDHYRGHIAAHSNAGAPTRRKAGDARNKVIAYKTKPCKFFLANKACSEGDNCTFIHDVDKIRCANISNNQDCRTRPSHLPPKPRSLLEEFKARDFHPISWRVIGGGVMMGPPSSEFVTGYCHEGRQAHDTEIKTSRNGVPQLKTKSKSRVASRAGQQSLHSSSDSKRNILHSGSSPAIQETNQGTPDGGNVPHTRCDDVKEEHPLAENSSITQNIVSSHYRRARSLSMPSSPSIFRAPHIFAEF